MFNVKKYKLGYCDEKKYTRVVCVCKYEDNYVFAYNKIRNGWEIPGGHIESGEDWEQAAKREMYEEVGATEIRLTPICVYKITTFGILCYCEILKIDKLPKESEMSKIMFAKELPDNLTYPESYKIFFNTVTKKIKELEKNV